MSVIVMLNEDIDISLHKSVTILKKFTTEIQQHKFFFKTDLELIPASDFHHYSGNAFKEQFVRETQELRNEMHNSTFPEKKTIIELKRSKTLKTDVLRQNFFHFLKKIIGQMK